jgi:hypothetical protein
MTEVGDRMTDIVPATLELEMRLVREAIAMVASGAAPRVVLAGIRYGDPLAAWGRRLAGQAGVILTPLWRSDEGGADLSVERMNR